MAKTLQGMLLGRLIVGFGMGLGSSVAALYVAEVCILICIYIVVHGCLFLIGDRNLSFFMGK